MVNYCVVPGCKSHFLPNSKIQFHTYPLRRPEILRTWISFTGKDANWQPSRHTRICSLHFRDEDYQLRHRLTVKFLKHDAIPSLLAPNTLESGRRTILTLRDYLNIENSLRGKTPSSSQIECNDIEHNYSNVNSKNLAPVFEIPENSLNLEESPPSTEHVQVGMIPVRVQTTPKKLESPPSTEHVHVYKISVGVQTTPEKLEPSHSSDKVALRRKIKQLEQKLHRRDKKIASMKKIIEAVQYNGHDSDHLLKDIDEDKW